MSLPVTVTVLGQVFPVIGSPDLRGDDGHPQYGRVEFDPHYIRINTNEPLETQKATLLHEIIHAAIRIGGLTEIMDGSGIANLEEAIVSNLDRALNSATIQRNRRSKPIPLVSLPSETSPQIGRAHV